jgi:hypothetical protein
MRPCCDFNSASVLNFPKLILREENECFHTISIGLRYMMMMMMMMAMIIMNYYDNDNKRIVMMRIIIIILMVVMRMKPYIMIIVR